MAVFHLDIDRADELARDRPDVLDAMEQYVVHRRQERDQELRIQAGLGD